LTLDPITVLATKTPETTTDSLSAVTSVQQGEINQVAPRRIEDVLIGIPGVWFTERQDSAENSINIRGLQDFGRVAVVIDGARQNFQRSGHNANGTFLIDPELLAGIDVVRGPVANVYGSGAIGGVASFRTKDVDDILRPGQVWGTQLHGLATSNPGNPLGSVFGAARVGPNVDLIVGGAARKNNDYKDGNGDVVPNTGFDMESGLAKIAVRPADGHQIKLSGISQHTEFDTGQPNPGESIFNTKMQNDIVSARWTYARPEDRLFDFDGNVYWTRTKMDQTKIDGTTSPITGAIGDSRRFLIETVGFDVHNSSRFDTGAVRHTLTYGGDFFRDEVTNSDPNGNGGVLTPNGERTVFGGFAQWKMNYSVFEWINAVRYDNYHLDGGGVTSDGDRLSPKTTLGITPFRGFTFYGTYAEGYRAPSTTETLVNGPHPPVFPGGSNLFTLVPNPKLRPEVGKNKEVGINVKYDNIFTAGDKFRGKFNLFRNDVEDYIDLVQYGPPICIVPIPVPFCPPGFVLPTSLAQYRNIAQARLEGAEVEANYDAGAWFAGVAASHVHGSNVNTGATLATVPPDKVVVTVGARFLDRKLTTAVRWIGVDASPAGGGFTPTAGYGIVNLYVGYEANRDVLLTLAVENLFDRQYVPYMSEATNNILAAPGITVKGGVQVRFGDDFFKKG
jgi:hemoglobin/transferrin/lactoferrin receptor protein